MGAPRARGAAVAAGDGSRGGGPEPGGAPGGAPGGPYGDGVLGGVGDRLAGDG